MVVVVVVARVMPFLGMMVALAVDAVALPATPSTSAAARTANARLTSGSSFCGGRTKPALIGDPTINELPNAVR